MRCSRYSYGLLAAALSACFYAGCVTPKPVVVPPAAPRPIAFHTCIPDLTVGIDGAGLPAVPLRLEGWTDANGNIGAPFLAVPASVTAFNLHITDSVFPARIQPYEPVVPLPPGNRDFFIGNCQPEQAGPTVTRLPAFTRNLPPPPTRDQILNVHISFQGLTVHCDPYGDLPWFEAALPWLSPDCRQAAYTAKRASSAWPGGDTHALVFLPSGPPLYDEADQPYSADRFGPLDWTAGNTKIDHRLPDLVAEIAQAGFTRQLLLLGGDDGSTCGQTPVPPQCGFVIAMRQLDLASDALQHSSWGDLRPYVVAIPGFDGVFYGYTPDQVHQWGAKCRTLFMYCGIEHSTGHIPAGDGPGEYAAPNGPMRVYDLILSEFDDDRFDDSVWQIAARFLGPAYVRPPDEPAADDTRPPAYLKDDTERGPMRDCAFEFGLFGQVHGQYNADHVNTAQRPYFTRLGYTCGG